MVTRERWFLLLAPALAFTAILIARLDALAIPMFAIGSMLILSAAGILGLIIGSVAASLHYVPAPRRAEALKLLILTGTIIVGLDVVLAGHTLLVDLLPFTNEWEALARRSARAIALLAIISTVFGFLWVLRQALANLVFLFCATLFITTIAKVLLAPSHRAVVDIQESSANAVLSNAPPIIYIVMDEMMGVEGLAQTADDGARIAANIQDVFLTRGFRLYGKAFSRHFNSIQAIPTALNFNPNDNKYYDLEAENTEFPGELKLFTKAANEGLSVHVYNGIDHENYDFCRSDKVQHCETFLLQRSMGEYFANSPQNHFFFYTNLLNFPDSYVGSLIEFIFEPPSIEGRLIGFQDWIAKVTHDMLRLGRGHMFFVHLLMPHSPYVLNSDCKLSSNASNQDTSALTEKLGLNGARFEEKRAFYYSLYFPQVECGMREIAKLLDRLDSTPKFADATIIVLGDHGSRISAGSHWEYLTTRDIIDNHSALFAIRGPGIESGYDLRLTSIQRLTSEYLSDRENLGPDDQTIVIFTLTGEAKIIPMPDFGAQSNKSNSRPVPREIP